MEDPNNPELVPETGSNEKDVIKRRNQDTSSDMWPDYCNPSYIMPPTIDVKVTMNDTDETYFFPLTIVKSTARKIYLGGYRNKLNGKVYHHANSQTPTDQNKASKNLSNLRSRDTQTYETRTLSVQSYRESGTQMERIDLKIDNKRDIVLHPKPYFTSDELMVKKKINLIEIQRCWRGYMARSRANQIRQRNVDFARKLEEDRIKEMEIIKEEKLKEMSKRAHPKTNQDFAALYNELDSWRKQEVAKIKSQTSDPEERKAAMSELLNHETKALQSLQKLKVSAQKEFQQERTQKLLEQMARPHVWQLGRGETAQVFTQETQRAQELLDLFNALNAPLLDNDQRLDVLLNVKWTVKEIDTALTRDIMDLIDREADLLSRGRAAKSMEKLRLRLSHLFLQFIEDPQYNPRASDFVVEK